MSREMKYVQQCMGVNGLEKIILREVRGFSAEVSIFICSSQSILALIITIHNLIHFYLVIHKPSFVSCSDLESQLSIALHCTPHFLCRFIYMGPKLHHGKMTLGKNCFLSVVRFKFHLHIYGSFWTCGFLK